jgi:alpha-tubulin suppressor-like RCC1 family protein
VKRIWIAALLVGCGHGRVNTDDAIAVAPKPVIAKPIEVVGDSSSLGGDVAPFELAIGGVELCARIEGKVHCGRGDDSQPIAASPPVGGIEDATSLSLGADFGCLTTRRGSVHCWGSNASAQLGAKIAAESSKDPVQVASITNAKRVFAGDGHACATTHEGALWCWGLNLFGETGGTTSWAPPARELAAPNELPLRDVTSVAMTDRSTCAAVKGGRVHCWGASFLSGVDTNEHPSPVASLKNIDELSAGAGAFCGVRGGEVYCAGSTYALIPEGADRDRDGPAKLDMKGIVKVRVGGSHACALARDGRVLCWGYDSNGELGRNEPYDPNTGYSAKDPQPVPGIGAARDIVVSRATSCAITGPEEVWCWGLWAYGTRGDSRQERGPVRLRVR